MPSCLLRLLLLQLLLLWADVSAAEAQKAPFRGELSAQPRGMDVLLGNVASSSPGRPAPASRPNNNIAPRSSTAPGQFFELLSTKCNDYDDDDEVSCLVSKLIMSSHAIGPLCQVDLRCASASADDNHCNDNNNKHYYAIIHCVSKKYPRHFRLYR